jgi:hypothetical protein
MCLSIHQTDRRARALLSIGMLCLVIGLASQALSLSFGLNPSSIHFVRGFFLGISLVFNIASLTLIARRRKNLQP